MTGGGGIKCFVAFRDVAKGSFLLERLRPLASAVKFLGMCVRDLFTSFVSYVSRKAILQVDQHATRVDDRRMFTSCFSYVSQ